MSRSQSNVDPFALLQCACFNTRIAARAVTNYYDEKLAPTGLRITQLAILGTIRAATSIPMQRLAQHLHLDPSTLTRTLQPLESAGLIRLVPGREDRRRRQAELTAKGEKQIEAAYALWEEAQDELRERLGAERFQRMIGDLSALTAALQS
jgi:DNA-binding MarR family transcriptional regulator